MHLSQFFMVSHPRPVRAAIERFRDQLDANPFATVKRGMGFDGGPHEESYPAAVQRAAARYLGGQPDEVALTDSTTQGLALVYNGLTLRPGEEILTTTHDHYVHHEAIRFASERSGASWRRIALYDESATASAEQMVERLRAAIRPQTRVIGLTWVHSCSGVKLPVRALAQTIADTNQKRDEQDRVLLVLDAVHGFGNQPEAAAGLGCDFLASSGHKWIFAPRGTGLLWAPARNWPLLRPTIPTAYDPGPKLAWEDGRLPGPTRAAWISPGGFKAYEHQWAMAEAFEFHARIGRERAAARIAALNTQCKEGLARIPGVRVLTPMATSLSAGIICFEVRGQTAEQTVRGLLGRKVIASSSPYKVSYARLAPSLVNDEREIDAAIRAVRKIV
ncbi:MAG: aminotransferase class V-fold PLP-dependent enzyme [Proteobacteria bacterium]|nr:aminotransferase class V-fold PLP-dependent enzyme [Pseudomonadota bacterium]